MSKIIVLIIELLLLAFGFIFINYRSKLAYGGTCLLVLAIAFPDLYVFPAADLGQYFREMNIVYPCNNISDLLNEYKVNSDLIFQRSSVIYNIFQWIISKSRVFTLLPFFVVSIICLSIFLPIVYQKNKYNINPLTSAFYLCSLFFLFPYWQMTITVRWMLAAGLFFLITYIYCNLTHLNLCKYIVIFIFYITLLFVHEAVILPLILLLMCTIIKRIKWYHYFVLILVVSLFFAYIRFSGYMSATSLLGNARSYSGVSDSSKQVSMLTQSGSAKLAFYTGLVIPFLYSFGDLIMLKHNNINGIYFEEKLFVVFNLVDILLLPYVLIAQRYSLYVGLVDWLLYLKAIRYNKHINNNTEFVFKIATVILGIVAIYATFKYLNFNFSGIVNYVGNNPVLE